MNTATVAVIALGVSNVAQTTGWLWLGHRVADRVRIVNPVKDAAAETVIVAPPRAVPLPPQTAQRQESFNRLRDDGKTPAQAAAALGITARTTVRDHEARRLAAQNGAGS